MSANRSKFLIGLFVIIGIFIGVSAVVWLGMSNYFAEGERYATYFDESVQGLSADSTVKYRGVTVGRVERIGIAPDNRLIEVIMKIDIDEELQRTTVAQLRPVGITGMVFVELNRRENEDYEQMPELPFEVHYPVIPSRPSGISEIFSRLHTLADRVIEIDLKGLSEDLKSVTAAARAILENPKIFDIVENLDRTLVRLERVLSSDDPDDLVVELHELLMEGRKLISGLNVALSEADLPEASKQMIAYMESLEKRTSDLMENLDRTVRFTAFEIRDVSSQLRGTARAIDGLVERLSLSPSDIIFSRPPERDREGEK
ncbi:MAG: MlaD family protein [Syntrophales bacterium]|nr:MlaD family protein [Syntrophales bacterium]